ncbi:Anti-repressor SinI [Alteribacillus persepolensis]|uniref:Anti-repressor SinI n=1 Tax=Alteribacillus persepolensis TaxID=568899 RepID=A0A1G8C5W8_9BACI|nr:anti-repressor SinI family protein [Alteribacillus persepolensis]SDH40917.1 Anti-repressor SinI [Alteribacillus persepolensis]
MVYFNQYRHLDEEWIYLIEEAKSLGLTPEEVLSFLRLEQE